MRRTWMRVALAAGAAITFFLATTLLALEGQEVVVLRTFDGNRVAEETRTWVADEEGFVWIESANAERKFYRHVLKNSHVELERGGVVLSFTATPAVNPEGHLRIRRLLREKYGWADRWIGLIADTSESIALRLEPLQ